MSFTGNALAILIAAVAAWVFGAGYYGALGKRWVAAQGKTMEAFRQEQAAKVGNITAILPFLLSFAGALIMAWVLNGILFHIGSYSVRSGLITGAFCWFGFVLTTMTVNNAYAGRKPMLTMIDAAHWLGVLLIMGAIIGGVGTR
jgi:hypothetical protein